MDFPIIIFSPALDIIAISVLFNVVAYGAYAYLFKREYAKIASIDIRLSLAELLLIVANFAGSKTVVTFGGFSVDWWLWYIIISIPIELLFFFSYKYYFKLSWEDIAGAGHNQED